MIYFLGEYLLWIQVILLGFVYRDALKALVAAFISRGIIVELIRLFYHRPRPYVVQNIQPLIDETSWSFPSGHASLMFAIATVVFMKNRTLGVIMYLMAIATGVARVMAHVHWTSDIIAGAVLGILVALVVNYFWPKINRPRQNEV